MLTIGKIAELSGLTTDAIRYYEKEGLISPLQKSDAGYRLYNDAALRRLRFIQQAQHCGFSLADILQLLTLQTSDASCCSDIRNLAVEKKMQLEIKIRDMKAMSASLDALITGCNTGSEPVNQCSILSSLESTRHD
jgi:DNA-binding transcriptional MerR regulator